MIFDCLTLNNDSMNLYIHHDVICKKDTYICFDSVSKSNIKESEVPTDYYNRSFLITDSFEDLNYDLIIEDAFVCLY